jgi:hypothetical protein
MELAIFDFPAAVIAGTVTYFLAWIASKVLRDAVIAWNYSARFAFECRRADFRRYTAIAHIPGGPTIEPESEDWLNQGGQGGGASEAHITRSPLAGQRGAQQQQQGGSFRRSGSGSRSGGRKGDDSQYQQQQQLAQFLQHQPPQAGQQVFGQPPQRPPYEATSVEALPEAPDIGNRGRGQQGTDDIAEARWNQQQLQERRAQQAKAFNEGQDM